LGKKLGPILFQLPPRWGVNLERLNEFLRVLPKKNHYAFEFRDPSWSTPAVYQLLRRYNAAFCIFEIAGWQSPIEVTADFTYVRLHGPGEIGRASCRERVCVLVVMFCVAHVLVVYCLSG